MPPNTERVAFLSALSFRGSSAPGGSTLPSVGSARSGASNKRMTDVRVAAWLAILKVTVDVYCLSHLPIRGGGSGSAGGGGVTFTVPGLSMSHR